ncbi:Conserved hypothetical protein 2217 (DUF2460) [Azospira oryzae PS]|uniref:DUF2460 domain-containing protein n=1 Tax=Azospira oryzae (strain ATCC BAA-33 / DSM 13638 / PS) TaxID=640081 RepID=G8QMP5_AZOOP|nr:DUF2460 domain-containing protein [Azospira oryzae]AEV24625.1 Conserved hypothetical protein 2217 (DUF2460) [Azospira oryzae PS]
MSNTVFPSNIPGLAWDNTKTPVFSSVVRTAASGKELRAAFYSYPLWDFKLSYELLRNSTVNGINELKTVLGFFLSRQGKFDSFLYEDPYDCAIADQQIGIGNGSNKVFQLVRDFGGFLEPVMNVKQVDAIKVGGVATTDYSIDSKGKITLTTAPTSGQVVTWSGGYYFRCRFKEDTAEARQFMYKLWDLKQLEFRGCLGDKV